MRGLTSIAIEDEMHVHGTVMDSRTEFCSKDPIAQARLRQNNYGRYYFIDSKIFEILAYNSIHVCLSLARIQNNLERCTVVQRACMVARGWRIIATHA
ncbi:unnamed protein product [Dovyalis caffra]|uniref:Uncharacterized protein n=1 Tax=Dovyalis caffra TaxID=77055 RepID=A0AAV1R105_9ROSI|nr:unnamed protein product [Dovyalis caffra]